MEYERSCGSAIHWEQRIFGNWIVLRRLQKSSWLLSQISCYWGKLLNAILVPVAVTPLFHKASSQQVLTVRNLGEGYLNTQVEGFPLPETNGKHEKKKSVKGTCK